jgi:hypothetical protein
MRLRGIHRVVESDEAGPCFRIFIVPYPGHEGFASKLRNFANEQPSRIGTLLATSSSDPSRSRTGRAFHPIPDPKGAYGGSETPVIISPLNASFVT